MAARGPLPELLACQEINVTPGNARPRRFHLHATQRGGALECRG
jgi:hypothetical protein